MLARSRSDLCTVTLRISSDEGAGSSAESWVSEGVAARGSGKGRSGEEEEKINILTLCVCVLGLYRIVFLAQCWVGLPLVGVVWGNPLPETHDSS